MPWSVYILECGDGTLYTGIATDVKRRLAQHRAGTGAKYTRGRGPLRLVCAERFPNRGKALQREAEVKSWTRQQKLKFITGG